MREIRQSASRFHVTVVRTKPLTPATLQLGVNGV